jgi:WD40 repeat protein
MGGDSRICLYVGDYMIVSVASGGGVWKSLDGYRVADVADRVYIRRSVSFTTDGKRFALWDGWPDTTGVITIHDVRKGERCDERTETEAVDSEGGGEFVTAMSADGEIQTRRVPERIELMRMQAHASATMSCAFSADNFLLVSGGADDKVKVWEWETATEIFSSDLNSIHPRPREDEDRSVETGWPRIREVKFVDEDTIAAAIDDEEIVVWNFRTGEHLRTVCWSGTFTDFPRQMPYVAEQRDDEICIVESDTGNEAAWFRCGRALASPLTLIPHPNGRAWAGTLGERVYHLVLAGGGERR